MATTTPQQREQPEAMFKTGVAQPAFKSAELAATAINQKIST